MSRPPDPPICYRCGDLLTETHWIRLSAAHQGPAASTYRDVDRPICPDCLAAIGLLEIVKRTQNSHEAVENGTDRSAPPAKHDAVDPPWKTLRRTVTNVER